MAENLYIAAMEPASGKSVVALGLMELLTRRIRSVGFFRPIIPGGEKRDNDIELILSRYRQEAAYEELYAYTYEDARRMVAEGRYEDLMTDIVSKYKALKERCDFVLCEGTDFTGVGTAFEFEFNADVANNLASPVLVLVNGKEKSPEKVLDAVQLARESFCGQGCTVLALIVNRVDPGRLEAVRKLLGEDGAGEEPVYVMPEQEILGKPTVAEIVEALDGKILQGDPQGLMREVRDFKIAAMHLPHFLEHVVEGALIITPGDRADVILGSIASLYSEAYPNIAGILLTGGLRPEPAVQRLLEGTNRGPVPVVSVATDTYTTAMNVDAVQARIKPANERKIASALGVFESNVDLKELGGRIAGVRSTRVTPIMFEYELIERARARRQHIVLPEGTEDRILRSCEILLRREVVDVTLLGDPHEVRNRIAMLGIDLGDVPVVNPADSPLREEYAKIYWELRKHKGIPMEAAYDLMGDVSYFGTMMVHRGAVDGMVSGAVHTTQHTIRPAFEIIRVRPGNSIVSSVFFMCLEDRVLVYGDCAVNPNPNAQQLADIAISSAETATMFGIEPRVAMLSYSTGGSGKGEDVEKVKEATRIARQKRPDLKIEGPIQYDAAVDMEVARTKMPESEVAGRATVFIFPDLNTGNNTYKAVQRSAGAVAIGPILQGLNKPVNDLSRGCTVTDVVNTVAITAIQAQAMKASP